MDRVLIYVVSLGCAKNRIDTEHMLGLLANSNAAVTDEPDEADVIIINTCGFIGDAKEESIDTILEMSIYDAKLIVTGCLSQRYAGELEDELPEVDAFLGVSSYSKIDEAISAVLSDKKYICIDRVDEDLVDRVLTTPSHLAYVRIADGCNNRCSYCAIPQIRGDLKSRPKASILKEITDLRDGGVSEVVLIAQDTTKYGSDFGDPMLPELIDEAAQIMKDGWLRVLYCYPEGITDEIIDAIKMHDNVCNYMDIPMQHFSDDVLKRMSRRHTQSSSKKIVRKLHAAGFALRTSLIVGFPGETKVDFDIMMKCVQELRFERLGVFRFSSEEGTPAHDMTNQISQETKVERYQKVMALQEGISQQLCESKIGSIVRVIVDGVDEDTGITIGRTMDQAPQIDGITYISTKEALTPGTFVDVKISKAYEYDLLGEIE
ncbi:MAG: 30S ribosomal protein S12 methylthiotransferase RimO [Clostridia bacterium]|jgi:ribosomal protein S12 methylthiotransferase|nr:30S ribosomal protein S12 methylthiotransferase RimO [Clostridia bacterium]